MAQDRDDGALAREVGEGGQKPKFGGCCEAKPTRPTDGVYGSGAVMFGITEVPLGLND